MKSMFSFEDHNPSEAMFQKHLQMVTKQGKLDLSSQKLESVYDVNSNIRNSSTKIEVAFLWDISLSKKKLGAIRNIIESIFNDFFQFSQAKSTTKPIECSFTALAYASTIVGETKRYSISEKDQLIEYLKATSKHQNVTEGSGEIEAINRLAEIGFDENTENFVFHFCQSSQSNFSCTEVNSELRDLSINYEIIYFGLSNPEVENALSSVFTIDVNFAED